MGVFSSAQVRSYPWLWIAFCCMLPTTSSAQLSSRGISLQLNGIEYFVSPYPRGNVSVDKEGLSRFQSAHGLYPVAVLDDGVGVTDISGLVGNWISKDDVFQDAFAEIVLLSEVSKQQMLSVNGTSVLALPIQPSTIPPGPYFLDGRDGTLYPVYRLYDDFAGAFSESLFQTPEGTFQTLSSQTATSATLTIGVPSRLYYTRTDAQPLAGVRIAVKDLVDLAGVKKSCGNRAWYNLYPPANVTGTAVQRLVDAGAVIVGHQKLSQFANGEQATADWVDYHSPFNPRGDGYQDPSSSSSGAGASIGSYPWLDMAVGSDTGGSIRGPAGVQGVFGSRPTHNLVSLDHVMPLSPTLDTLGFLLRDPFLWDAACSAMYGANYTSYAKSAQMHYPKQILTYDFPTDQSGPLYTAFADALASFVSGNATNLNLTEMWASTGPPEGRNTSMPLFLNTTYPTLIAKEQTALVREQFFADYASVHDGRKPFTDPTTTLRWAWADTLPSSALQDAMDEKTSFMDWFNTQILPPADDPEQCSSALFLYPYAGNSGVPSPRNTYLDPPIVPYGYSGGYLSVFAEVPDHVYPIGQVPSHSNITNHVEYLPVAVDIMAAKGCDGMLVKLAQDLVTAGILKQPLAGQTIYGGDVLMKRNAAAAGIERVRYVG